jgi:hypothetical protein
VHRTTGSAEPDPDDHDQPTAYDGSVSTGWGRQSGRSACRSPEVTVRTSELARLDPPVGQVIIVENDVSYLALPDRPGTVAIFGAGFALGSVAGLSWLSSKTITYWGDIDTYGFVILNRLRARYPRVVSILMDAETLLAHPDQWVAEESPPRSRCRI